MHNIKLLQLLESILGKGKSTSGNNVAFFSPFTTHHKPKLEINLLTNTAGENTWHCWITNRKGRTIASLFKQLKQPKEKFEQLSKIIQTSKYNHTDTDIIKNDHVELPADYQPLWIYKKSYEYNAALNYLKSRGITMFDILRYRIGYAEEGDYKGRIIIPSYDTTGQLNYFVSRIYRDRDTLKHKNPPVSKNIIGFELLINWDEPIILCEGAFDAIAIKRNAIPLFGKIIQPVLRKKIIEEHVKDIYICLDNDALVNAIDIAEQFMNEGLNVYFVELQSEDASELGYITITDIILNTTQLTFEKIMSLRMSLLWK